MRLPENKWLRAALPALLIHCSIGTVYCWSSFSAALADAIGAAPQRLGFAFSLAIFFLGMSAAFAGPFIERNVHKAALVACLFLPPAWWAPVGAFAIRRFWAQTCPLPASFFLRGHHGHRPGHWLFNTGQNPHALVFPE